VSGSIVLRFGSYGYYGGFGRNMIVVSILHMLYRKYAAMCIDTSDMFLELLDCLV
jgi:hypothetical protein